ncbi:MAG: glycerate kinase [Hydrogenibacillus sp.]|nr:glycerate kinase [Hydrogenibacillus sp.]
MRVLIAPDKFKGTLTARRAAEATARALDDVWPEAAAVLLPMADGGEGTLEAVLSARGGRRETLVVEGPSLRPRTVPYGVVEADGEQVAVIESAEVVGAGASAAEAAGPVLRRSTFGLGQMIVRLKAMGFRRFWIGLGGSLTNDGGLGMLAALGARFWDAAGRPLPPFAESLLHLSRSDTAPALERVRDLTFTVWTDVAAPLVGPNGATVVFGPQKGLAPEIVAPLDAAMRRYAEQVAGPAAEALIRRCGAGAAGGLGFAFALVGAALVPGAEGVASIVGLERAISAANVVVTGEGKTDRQTAMGKVPLFVAETARRLGRPAVLLSGRLGEGWEALSNRFDGMWQTVSDDGKAPLAPEDAEDRLYRTARELFRTMRAARLLKA